MLITADGFGVAGAIGSEHKSPAGSVNDPLRLSDRNFVNVAPLQREEEFA